MLIHLHFIHYSVVLSHSRLSICSISRLLFFFFNDTATTEIYTLSLHDALPISPPGREPDAPTTCCNSAIPVCNKAPRSEEHTSELQSRQYLVCRLLLEKKKKKKNKHNNKKTNSAT